MEINPQGLKHFPDNTPSSVLSNRWHHVVARFDGDAKQVWVDGREVAELEASPVRSGPGDAALRIGAAGLKGEASSLPRRRSRHAGDLRQGAVARGDRGPVRRRRPSRGPPTRRCWPAGRSTRSGAIARPTRRRTAAHARIINHGTWMIGGPSFDADVPRFGDVRPGQGPPARPRPAAGVRRSLRLPLEGRRTNSALPEDARSGIYVGRFRFQLDGEERLYHTRLHRQEGGRRGPRRRSRSCARPTPGGPTRPRRSARRWTGLKKSIGNNGFANSPGDPPAFCFYRPHHAGQGTYQIGFRMPWPIVGPYTTDGPGGVGLQPPLPAGSVHAGLARGHRATPTTCSATPTCTSTRTSSTAIKRALRRRPQRILVVRGDERGLAGSSIGAATRSCSRATRRSGGSRSTRMRRVMECRKGGRAGDAGPSRPSRRDVAQPRRPPGRHVA